MATAQLSSVQLDFANGKAYIFWADGEIWELNASSYAEARQNLLNAIAEQIDGAEQLLKALVVGHIALNAPTQGEAGAYVTAWTGLNLTNANVLAFLDTHAGT